MLCDSASIGSMGYLACLVGQLVQRAGFILSALHEVALPCTSPCGLVYWPLGNFRGATAAALGNGEAYQWVKWCNGGATCPERPVGAISAATLDAFLLWRAAGSTEFESTTPTCPEVPLKKRRPALAGAPRACSLGTCTARQAVAHSKAAHPRSRSLAESRVNKCVAVTLMAGTVSPKRLPDGRVLRRSKPWRMLHGSSRRCVKPGSLVQSVFRPGSVALFNGGHSLCLSQWLRLKASMRLPAFCKFQRSRSHPSRRIIRRRQKHRMTLHWSWPFRMQMAFSVPLMQRMRLRLKD